MTLSFTLQEFPTSDFQLVTGDGVVLHVHRSILEMASPFFRDMLSLPQPSTSRPSAEENMVHIPEDAEALSTLLTMIYPMPSDPLPISTPLSKLARLLAISLKYFFLVATSKLTDIIISRANTKPKEALRIYAIGCNLDVEELMNAGSRACLRCGYEDLFDIDEDNKELSEEDVPDDTLDIHPSVLPPKDPQRDELLKQMSAWDYQRLLRLHRRRTQAIKSLLLRTASPSSNDTDTPLEPPPCAQCSATPHFGLSVPPKWWMHFREQALIELDSKGPDTEWMFGEEFLRSCVKAGCARCGTSLLGDGGVYLKALKKRIDGLADCV